MSTKCDNRKQVLARLLQPVAPSISVMSEETGIPTATLHSCMAQEKKSRAPVPFNAGAIGMNKQSKHRTLSKKLRVISGSLPLEGDALLTFCASHGVTVDELLSWCDLTLTDIKPSERDGLCATRKEHDMKGDGINFCATLDFVNNN